jgi:hypothetical protein
MTHRLSDATERHRLAARRPGPARMRLSLRGTKNDGKHHNMHGAVSIFGRFCDRLCRHAHLQPNP